VNKEGCNLNLCDVIEGNQADVAVLEGTCALVNLAEDLVGVVAAEHGQLPHRPVTVVVVVDAELPNRT